MNRVLIPQGRHRPRGFSLPKLYFGRFDLRFAVRFTDESDYSFGNADDYDINKIEGVSWNGWHKHNSVRIGWNTHGLWLYAYVGYERVVRLLAPYEKGRHYVFRLRSIEDSCVVSLDERDVQWLEFSERFKCGYEMGHYFGGGIGNGGAKRANAAPKDIAYYFNSL